MDEVIEKAIKDKITPKNEDVTELDWLQSSVSSSIQ
jgi:hypothetical protein